VYDAVILNNPDTSSSYDYCVAMVYKDNNGGNLAFYEWTTSGLNLVMNHNFTGEQPRRIAMDAHELYAYVVVWEGDDSLMYSFGGYTPQPAMFPLIGPVKHIY